MALLVFGFFSTSPYNQDKNNNKRGTKFQIIDEPNIAEMEIQNSPIIEKDDKYFLDLLTNNEATQRHPLEYKQEHEFWKLKFTRRTLEWQFISSIIIFLMVISVVIAGLFFSYIQFQYTVKTREYFPGNEVKIGKAGLEISSSVIGLAILFFSLIFFYLYLTEVYPIKQIEAKTNNLLNSYNGDSEKITLVTTKLTC